LDVALIRDPIGQFVGRTEIREDWRMSIRQYALGELEQEYRFAFAGAAVNPEYWNSGNFVGSFCSAPLRVKLFDKT
jgi:hypothetical protein